MKFFTGSVSLQGPDFDEIVFNVSAIAQLQCVLIEN